MVTVSPSGSSITERRKNTSPDSILSMRLNRKLTAILIGNDCANRRGIFGLDSEDRKKGSEFGKRAAALACKLLSKPFTVHTAFKAAQGRSKKPRIYVMITTSDGKDLAKILVQEGLARAHGIGRKRPDGISAKDYREHLRDVELEAAVKQRGAWELANFDRIVELREEFRREKRAGDAEVTEGETAEREEREGKSD